MVTIAGEGGAETTVCVDKREDFGFLAPPDGRGGIGGDRGERCFLTFGLEPCRATRGCRGVRFGCFLFRCDFRARFCECLEASPVRRALFVTLLLLERFYLCAAAFLGEPLREGAEFFVRWWGGGRRGPCFLPTNIAGYAFGNILLPTFLSSSLVASSGLCCFRKAE